ncbi:MAG: hypothetical protein DHS20C07_31700 [Methyloligella sp.]|nr:MAG: hypothetical protein DHS20C07_31700 [Methyloligella sp.]
MKLELKNLTIGYSGFILFEECYEYNENACYLASNLEKARQFMFNCGYDRSEFRIDQISLNDLMNDYGCSSGEYAMEELAFEKFKKNADKKGINYRVEDFELDASLKVVNILGI